MSARQYGIIRVQKTKSAAVGWMQYHNDRQYGRHANVDIDPERTELNRELVPHGDYEAEVAGRIGRYRQSSRKVRKDAVVLVEGVVTASPDFFKRLDDEQTQAFFDDCFEFVRDEAGAENMVHFTVHMDETTPHAHFGFTPIKDGSLSWKKFFDGREALRGYQDRFHERVGERWGLERGETNDPENPTHHKTTEQMKRDSRAELERLQEQVRQQKDLSMRLNVEIADKRGDVEELDNEIDHLQSQRASLERENARLATENGRMRETSDALAEKVKAQRKESADLAGEISRFKALKSRLEGDVSRLQELARTVKSDALKLIREVKEIADQFHTRPFLGSWKSALENLAMLADNSIARQAGRAAGGWLHEWSERDARKADRVIAKSVDEAGDLLDDLVGEQESLEEDIERYKPQSLDDLAGEMRDTAEAYNHGREVGGGRDWER